MLLKAQFSLGCVVLLFAWVVALVPHQKSALLSDTLFLSLLGAALSCFFYYTLANRQRAQYTVTARGWRQAVRLSLLLCGGLFIAVFLYGQASLTLSLFNLPSLPAQPLMAVDKLFDFLIPQYPSYSRITAECVDTVFCLTPRYRRIAILQPWFYLHMLTIGNIFLIIALALNIDKARNRPAQAS
jgi:hypothetical protein